MNTNVSKRAPASGRGAARGLRWGMSLLFVAAGIMHLLKPALFVAAVPPGFGPPAFDVVTSGIAEIAGGVGLLISPLRRAAGLGLILLLLAVWPANWYMAIAAGRFAQIAPAWALQVRPLLQLPLLWLVWKASR